MVFDTVRWLHRDSLTGVCQSHHPPEESLELGRHEVQNRSLLHLQLRDLPRLVTVRVRHLQGYHVEGVQDFSGQIGYVKIAL